MQSKSEEIKAHEINRLIMAHKEKYPDDFGDLKERFIAIFGKNETKIISWNRLHEKIACLTFNRLLH